MPSLFSRGIDTWENNEYQVTTVHNNQFESSYYYLQIVNLHVVGSVFTKKYSRNIECIYLLKLSFDSVSRFLYVHGALKNLIFSQHSKQKWRRPESVIFIYKSAM